MEAATIAGRHYRETVKYGMTRPNDLYTWSKLNPIQPCHLIMLFLFFVFPAQLLNLALEKQAVGRVYRLGQSRPVTVSCMSPLLNMEHNYFMAR